MGQNAPARVTTSSALVGAILAVVFLSAFVIGGGLFFLFQYRYALDNSAVRAQGLLAIAQSIRAYTSQRVAPVLQQTEAEFHSEGIPAFAVQTIFRGMKTPESTFSYRERMLNPTNPLDRADGFDTALVDAFRADRDLTETSGTRSDATGATFYVAHPIVISDPACLACHSTPDAAPKAVLAKFGPQNGFNWSLAAYLAIRHSLNRYLFSPLRQIAGDAEQQSRTIAAPPPKAQPRLSELIQLSAAFERLRASALLGRRRSEAPAETETETK
jgi:Protein of unknown function (DUF3365)